MALYESDFLGDYVPVKSKSTKRKTKDQLTPPPSVVSDEATEEVTKKTQKEKVGKKKQRLDISGEDSQVKTKVSKKKSNSENEKTTEPPEWFKSFITTKAKQNNDLKPKTERKKQIEIKNFVDDYAKKQWENQDVKSQLKRIDNSLFFQIHGRHQRQ